MSRIKWGNSVRDILRPLAEWGEVARLKKTLCVGNWLVPSENLFNVESTDDRCTDSPQRRLETALRKVTILGPSGWAAGLVGKQENKWKTVQEGANKMCPCTHTNKPMFMGSGRWLTWQPGSPSASPMAMLLHLAMCPICTWNPLCQIHLMTCF